MNTLSITEFKALLSRPDWQRVQKTKQYDSEPFHYEFSDSEDIVMSCITTKYYYLASLTSTLDGITVIYNRSFSYVDILDDPVEVTADGLPDRQWLIKGVSISDGHEKLNAEAVEEFLYSILPDIQDFCRINYERF